MNEKKKLKTTCSETAGRVMPVVNFNNCGDKGVCVEVCPHKVFELRPITADDAAKLNLKGKLKTFFFKNKAYVVDPENCHGCGICVKACPERAIKLAKLQL